MTNKAMLRLLQERFDRLYADDSSIQFEVHQVIEDLIQLIDREK